MNERPEGRKPQERTLRYWPIRLGECGGRKLSGGELGEQYSWWITRERQCAMTTLVPEAVILVSVGMDATYPRSPPLEVDRQSEVIMRIAS